MGILDDAIREHLELKRQHGAESDDLERLENEAFGPATRPGDPEYSTGESAAVPDPAGDAQSEVRAETEPAGGFFDFGGDSGESSEWAAAEEEPTRIVPAESTPAEAARADYPELGETADHPAPPPPMEEPPSDEAPLPIEERPQPAEEPPATEAAEPSPGEPPEAPEHAIFDSGEIDFGDLGLDLDEEAPAPAAPAQPPEVPLADSPFEEDPDDLALETGENESSLADPAAPPPVVDGEGEGDEEGEDLLEETPDFLQDAPEGERLWFEQGAPKDFDFDDD